MFPVYLESEAALEGFLAAFEAGTFPKQNWTHGAHVAMAASYTLTLPPGELLDRTRERIQHYNVCQGGQNTEESGYHETLTVLWLGIIRAFLESKCSGLDRLAAVRAAYAEFAGRTSLWRDYYSFNVIESRQARREWIAPNLKTIE